MTNYNDNVTVKSIFGEISIEYFAAETCIDFEGNTVIEPSEYIATIQDGEWNGWNGRGATRGTALTSLMTAVGERYGQNLESQI